MATHEHYLLFMTRYIPNTRCSDKAYPIRKTFPYENLSMRCVYIYMQLGVIYLIMVYVNYECFLYLEKPGLCMSMCHNPIHILTEAYR